MSCGTRRRRSAALLAAAVAAVGATVSCSVEQSVAGPDCSSGGSVIIVAQSVPTASHVICFDPLPSGWSITSVSVTEKRSVITFDSDRVGSSAAVLRYDEECDTSDAVASPSDLPPTRRFDRIEQVRPGLLAERFYVFAGGCVSWRFDFDDGTSATEAVAIGDTLVLVPRREFNDLVRETFVDEDI